MGFNLVRSNLENRAYTLTVPFRFSKKKSNSVPGLSKSRRRTA